MACNGCYPLIDKQPPGPGVAAFEIELLSCDLDQSSTYRNFIYRFLFFHRFFFSNYIPFFLFILYFYF